MKKTILFSTLLTIFAGCNRLETLPPAPFQTVCNPVNLSYMFQPVGNPAFREGADATVMIFKDEYYAFVSHSGGYFHSTDMTNWKLIVPNDVFPVEHYSPTTVVIDDEVYLISSFVEQVVKTSDLKSGIWEVAIPDFKLSRPPGAYDPCLFLDDDGRLYCYSGCSNTDPIVGCELDPKTFDPVTERIPLIYANPQQHGWEQKSDYNAPNPAAPWIEGAWMNKYKGKYYLQYAAPGTELKSYNDGVYVSDNPLGPYTLAEHNPFALKPEGFVCGAGHGSTFQDKHGNYWHIGTVNIGVRQSVVERRLSILPLFFDDDNEMYACTGFGDYPTILPDRKFNSPDDFFTGWMLLSYGKKVEVSSTLPQYVYQTEKRGEKMNVVQNNDIKNINDEDVRTWWSAASGSKEEWFKIDLGEMSDVYALQINFADEGAQLHGRADSIYYQYVAEASADGKNWQSIVDRSTNTVDMPHDYIQLSQPVKARYLRVNNIYCPSGNFSVSDFRVFGKSGKAAPQPVQNFTVERDADTRTVHLKWDASPDAVGYNIRYGTRKDKLYHNYMVYGKNELSIHSLHAEKDYYFAIDAFNEGGVTKGFFQSTYSTQRPTRD